MQPVVVWIRNDFRVSDHQALFEACQSNQPVVCLYIYENNMGSATQVWLHHALKHYQKQLEALNIQLAILKGDSYQIIPSFLQQINASSFYFLRNYEPKILKKDVKLTSELKSLNFNVEHFQGNVLKEPWTFSNQSQKPFQVFTPFWKALSKCVDIHDPFPIPQKQKAVLSPINSLKIEDLELLPKISWDKPMIKHWEVGEDHAQKLLSSFQQGKITAYLHDRDFPFIDGSSKLSPYLHFGHISAKQIFKSCQRYFNSNICETSLDPFVRQLFWREFAHHLLFHFPHTENQPLDKKFEHFQWDYSDEKLKAWQKGLTGYPIVDAGMRQLWQEGWMHNRVRMIVGSFLVKDLMISWQEGFNWFWDTLLDADLANNVLGWQWIAGCGADAAPYFRIFNPYLQSEKFDPRGEYIRKYLPELQNLPDKFIHNPSLMSNSEARSFGFELGRDYPHPICNHDICRKKALEKYEKLKTVH